MIYGLYYCAEITTFLLEIPGTFSYAPYYLVYEMGNVAISTQIK